MLQLTQTILARLDNAATSSGDEECCGFLLGFEHGDHRAVTVVLEVANMASDRRRNFKISADDYMKAERFATENNICLLGVYHSHPNAMAIPSEQDRLAALPHFSYLILSVLNGKIDNIRSWRLNTDFQFKEETLSFISINHPIHGYSNYSNTAA